ncbi:hypothetical protein [Hymenobacter cavernae]|uniref:Right-handed parallel beta-helix repeat-containing protein n=1 Tax=Hymenobacter cavernae TaxID=2044852 RepID=A0ABQ1TS85_9BACT|nr:hypothetical protein [Hymenobacter cavernae]GGF02138.1 hypothetical protein GCM10011383_11270 [Hymenobacter cavernae]
MRYFLPVLFLFACALCLLPGCEPKEDIVTKDGGAKLAFSTDTVFFDTVFVQTGSVTKRLWVYNRNNRAVKVEQIGLGAPTNSPYTLIIGGQQGTAVQNVEIRGKDSLLVLVRTSITPGQEDKPFVVEDQLRFRTNGNDQDVKLLAYGQNAYFHRGLEYVACNSVWRSDKPHVVLDTVAVGQGCTLTIAAGSRVYFHANAAIVVQGRLLVNPDFNPGTDSVGENNPNIVRFAGDRREPYYNDIPGQWRGIQFDATSRNNVVRYAEIKNASFGLLIFNPKNLAHPKVRVENTVIKNISGAAISFANGKEGFDGAGIFGISGDFDLVNTVLTNCGEYAIRAIGGGEYNLNFCTVANYTPQFKRETASLRFSNASFLQEVKDPLPMRIDIRNSIIWGINSGFVKDELLFEGSDNYKNSLSVRNSLLRTTAYQAATDAPDKPGLGRADYQNVLNQPPNFKRASDSEIPAYDKLDFRLNTPSPASNRTAYESIIARDLRNNLRDPKLPDLGAYEQVNP